jgi:hypothetical protein
MRILADTFEKSANSASHTIQSLNLLISALSCSNLSPIQLTINRISRQVIAQGFKEAIGLQLNKQRDRIYVSDLAARLWQSKTVPGPKEKIHECAGHAYTGLVIVRQ